MGVSKNRGTPKSWILIGFSIINHPFWGPTPIFGKTHVGWTIKISTCQLKFIFKCTLPETNSKSACQEAGPQKETPLHFQPFIFRCYVKHLVSGRVYGKSLRETLGNCRRLNLFLFGLRPCPEIPGSVTYTWARIDGWNPAGYQGTFEPMISP